MNSFQMTFYRLLKGIAQSWNIARFQATFLLACLILLTGTLFYRNVEGWSWVDSLYHSVMLASTVGGSHLHPQTEAGKVFSVLYILVGVGVFVVLFTEFARALIDDQYKLLRKRRK